MKMVATGIVRRIDDLGRVVIPKEIRRRLRVHDGDAMEIFVDLSENCVCFKRYDLADNTDLLRIYRILLEMLNCFFDTGTEQLAVYSRDGDLIKRSKRGLPDSLHDALRGCDGRFEFPVNDFRARQLRDNNGNCVGYYVIEEGVNDQYVKRLQKVSRCYFEDDPD